MTYSGIRKNADASATYSYDYRREEWTVFTHSMPADQLRKGKTIGVTIKAGFIKQEKLNERIWISDDGKEEQWTIQQKD